MLKARYGDAIDIESLFNARLRNGCLVGLLYDSYLILLIYHILNFNYITCYCLVEVFKLPLLTN